MKRPTFLGGLMFGLLLCLPTPTHALPAFIDEFSVTLAKLSAGIDEITASFSYIDGGVAGPVTTFASTADIFNGENFTRAAFVAFTPAPVPEPSTLAFLLGAGLVA